MRVLLAWPAAALLACATAAHVSSSPASVPAVPASVPAAASGPLELIESWPLETTLDHADIRDAKDVWPELIGRAGARLDIAEFYLSNEAGSALEPVVLAVEAAAARGVRVRVLAEQKFTKTYPETLARLAAHANVQVRPIDYQRLAGGILHAKYFIVDGREAYLGSQNFDYRSLSHIQELGLRIRVPEVVRALLDAFETDWLLAGGPGGNPAPAPAGTRASPPPGGYQFPAAAGRDEKVEVTAVLSPKGFLPDEKLWDLPALVELIDSARRSVRVQVLTYKARGRGDDFPELEEALERAAMRGVSVELIVSHWSLRKGTLPGLQALEKWGESEGKGKLGIKVMTIPEFSGGHIPFARVVHAKYLVVDGARAWVGTSNWERDYFHASRNVGLIVDGGAIPPRLDAFFQENWDGAYTAYLDPLRAYDAPRTGP